MLRETEYLRQKKEIDLRRFTGLQIMNLGSVDIK